MSLAQSKAVWLALACALPAAYFAPNDHGDGVVLTERVRRTAPNEIAAVMTPPSHLAMRAITQRVDVGDDQGRWGVMGLRVEPMQLQPVIAKRSELSRSLPVEASSAPTTPEPPALPFKYLGRALIEGGTRAFLQYRDQNLVVKPGDTIADLYRIDGIDDANIHVTYLPLNVVQRMAAQQY